MNKRRTVLIFVGLLLVIGLAFLWYKIITPSNTKDQDLPESAATLDPASTPETETTTLPKAADNIEQEQTPSGTDPEGVAFTITVATLPPLQQQALRLFGGTGEELVVSQAVVACIETELGFERLLLIRDGAVPSFREGVVIVDCYTSN